MKKKMIRIVCVVIALFLVVLAVLGFSFRKIEVVSGKDFVYDCPRYALPGREVTVLTADVADGEIWVTGADGKYVGPGEYVFTMPKENVRLKVGVEVYPDGS